MEKEASGIGRLLKEGTLERKVLLNFKVTLQGAAPKYVNIGPRLAYAQLQSHGFKAKD